MRYLAWLLWLPLLFVATAAVAEPSASDIMRRSVDAYRVLGIEATLTLTIIDEAGRTRERVLDLASRWVRGEGVEQRLLRFRSPADVKGTGLLSIDRDGGTRLLWLYLPALKKTRRIASAERSRSFVGSEFSYADIVPPARADFDYRTLGHETVAGVACTVIEATPRTSTVADELGGKRRVVWVDAATGALWRAAYYDANDRLFKEFEVSKVEVVDPKNGLLLTTRATMRNRTNKRSSTLAVDRWKLRTDLSEDFFSQRELERP